MKHKRALPTSKHGGGRYECRKREEMSRRLAAQEFYEARPLGDRLLNIELFNATEPASGLGLETERKPRRELFSIKTRILSRTKAD